MKLNKLVVVSFSAAVLSLSGIAFGQSTTQSATQTVVGGDRPVAVGNNLYCAGYIQNAPITENYEVVGGEQEQEQRVYTEGNNIYINAGAQQGVKENDRFIVTRPRGGFRSPFSRKGKLGIFVQEVGVVRMISVKPQVSVAVVENSCETILLGDLLVPFSTRVSPQARQEAQFDRFRDPSGKATGRIVLARDGQESLSRDQIVYLDLGTEDGVSKGDYLTIYRPLGGGSITRANQNEIVRSTDYGFESDEFRGGKFSSQAPRKKGSNADGNLARTPDVKKRRPQGLRKIVGEVIVLNVQQRTATAVITRTAQEIHTGDYVELQ